MPAPVRQSQITRAVKAVQAAGVPVGRIEISPDGTVKIFTGVELINADDKALESWSKRRARKD